MAKSMSGAIESMSYALFRAAITEPALLEIAAHWHAARGDRLLPAWRDIDACALAPHLPIVWSWRYDFTRDTFVGRLAGEEINAMLGVSIRGKTIEECFAPDAVPVVRQRYQAVMDGPSFMFSHGKVFARAGHTGSGTRIVLPLADDGVRPDGLLGATVYRLGIVPTARDGATIDHHNEIVTHYKFTH
jgi:hypothetical protein